MAVEEIKINIKSKRGGEKYKNLLSSLSSCASFELFIYVVIFCRSQLGELITLLSDANTFQDFVDTK